MKRRNAAMWISRDLGSNFVYFWWTKPRFDARRGYVIKDREEYPCMYADQICVAVFEKVFGVRAEGFFCYRIRLSMEIVKSERSTSNPKAS
jgi:hypothetical protein